MALLALTNANIYQFMSFGPIKIRRIHGYNNQAANVYIQLHQKIPDSIATPLATGNVPTFKSLVTTPSNGFMYTFGEEGVWFDPLVIGMSSTETTFTAVGANAGIDCTIEYDSSEYVTNGNETITGDLSTGVSVINPWTDSVANAGRRLLRVDYTNNDGATRFLLLSTDAGTTNLADQVYQVANGATITKEFFPGYQTFSQDATFTAHYGCRLLQSTSASVAGVTATTVSFIKALWR